MELKMIKRSGFILLASTVLITMVFVANPAIRVNAVGQKTPAGGGGLKQPERASTDYWIIKNLSMRTLACLCANKYPVGLGAGTSAEFTYRAERNENGEEVAIYSLCVQTNKEWNRRIVGSITLPLTSKGEVIVATPKDDRYNPTAAVLREKLKGAVLVPFKRQGYRLSRCPTSRDHYQGLNWAEPERWPGM